MNTLADQFVHYLSELTGQPVAWDEIVSASLPQHLAQRYALRGITVGARWFLGIFLKDANDFRPVTFAKQLRQLMAHGDDLEGYCLVAAMLPAYVRKRLIERHIPFVVPGRQVYWPALGHVISRQAAGSAPHAVAYVSPATQLVLLLALNEAMSFPVTPKALAARLGFTAMTMTRALDEIEANELGRVDRQGRERWLDFPAGRKALWGNALPYLRNPVRKTLHVMQTGLPAGNRIMAGETALAGKGMLAAPAEPVYALGRESWKALADKVEQVPVMDEGTCRLQLWRYEPGLLARQGMVDRFSLYLSLMDEHDERVQIALDEMMEHAAWSRDSTNSPNTSPVTKTGIS